MQNMDFSRYDGVLSPVIVLSSSLGLLYSNGIASRTYPILTSAGLRLYFTKNSISRIAQSLEDGQAVSSSPDSDVAGVFHFEPVLDGEGRLSHVFLFVGSSDVSAESALALTGEEFFRQVQHEVAEPVYDLLRLTDHLQRVPAVSADSETAHIMNLIRNRLFRISRFFSHSPEGCKPPSSTLPVTDFGAVLTLCASAFPPLDFCSAGRFLVPLSRDLAIRMMVSILSSVVVGRTKGSRIIASAENLSKEILVTVRFRRAKEGDLFALGSDEGNGFYFACRTLSEIGGHLEINGEEKGYMNICLRFPHVSISPSAVRFNSPSQVLSDTALYALEYLRCLGESSAE